MNLDRINGKLQEKFSINKYELYFSYLIFIGMFAAFVMQQVIGNINQNESETAEFEEVAEVIYQKLDSLEKADQSTYLGTDIAGNVNPQLAKGDTIIKKESDFPSAKKKGTPNGLININKATKFELMRLPGIGEKTADVIIEYRKTKPFTKIEDIMNIKGIGPKKFEKMKEFVKVD
jgi:competence protein ComEA